MPLVSEKRFADSNQVFELPKAVLLLGLHQRAVSLLISVNHSLYFQKKQNYLREKNSVFENRYCGHLLFLTILRSYLDILRTRQMYPDRLWLDVDCSMGCFLNLHFAVLSLLCLRYLETILGLDYETFLIFTVSYF